MYGLRLRVAELFVVWVLVLGLMPSQARGQVELGEKLSALGLEGLLNAPDGAEATLESLAGKTVVLEFWATWCVPCIGEIPHLNELRAEFVGEDVVFISVTDEPAELVGRFQERMEPIEGWIGLDHDRSLFDAFEIRFIPATIIIDTDGRFVGRISPRDLDATTLRSYMSGRVEELYENIDPEALDLDEDSAQGEEEDEQATFTWKMIPGIDPYSTVQTAADSIFIFRDSIHVREYLNSYSSATEVIALAATTEQALGFLYPWPASLWDTSALLYDETARHDLIVGGAFPMEMARKATLRVLGIEQRIERREMTVYRLREGDGGLRNLTPLGVELDWATGPFVQSGRIIWDSNRIAPEVLADVLGKRLGVPVESMLDADLLFDAELTFELPDNDEEIAAQLLEKLGVEMVGTTEVRDVMVLVPRAE